MIRNREQVILAEVWGATLKFDNIVNDSKYQTIITVALQSYIHDTTNFRPTPAQHMHKITEQPCKDPTSSLDTVIT